MGARSPHKRGPGNGGAQPPMSGVTGGQGDGGREPLCEESAPGGKQTLGGDDAVADAADGLYPGAGAGELGAQPG
jgi:hypothetical protein